VARKKQNQSAFAEAGFDIIEIGVGQAKLQFTAW
jgi:methylmalonyl-CoA mutase cobalamin-binding subunit